MEARNEVIQTSAARYLRMLETSREGIWIIDRQGRTEFVNQRLASMLGARTEDLVGGNPLDYVDADWLQLAGQSFGAQQAPPSGSVEVKFRRKGGSEIWTSVQRCPLSDPGGQYDGAAFWVQDINEQKRKEDQLAALVINLRESTARRDAEEALIRGGARYRAIFENAPLGIYLTSPEGQYLSMNQALAAIYGFDTPEDVIQNSADIKRLYVDPEKWEEFRRSLAEQGVVRNFECEVCRRDGTRRWLVENGRAVYGDKGEVLYYQGVIEDVTERKSLESQLRQSQRLEAVGRLAGGVAHDFNNMLGVIIGYSGILRTQLPSDHQALKGAAEIEQAAHRAADLTRQLLAFSRKQVLQPQVLSLNSLIDELSKMLRRLIGEDVELVFRPGWQLARVKADPGQFEQVIMNLVVNARDAMPGGGRILIETKNVDVDEHFALRHSPMLPGPYVLLSVRDTGSGMTAEVLSHIFDPFFTTKEQGRGTGLGLSIVYGIVKQSGGYTWVDSEPDRGSTFQIYFPPTTEAETTVALHARPASIGGAETILVVEDEASLREVIRIVLTSAGYKVLEAGTGLDALSLLRDARESVHLLMTDIVMPGKMNGWDLAKSVGISRPGTQILFMTGFGSQLDTFGIVIAPEATLLDKPFTADLLLRKVRDAIDSRSGASSAAAS